MSHAEQISQSVTKLEFLAGVIANSSAETIRMDGFYFTFSSVIEEIKSALDGITDRPAYAAINKIA